MEEGTDGGGGDTNVVKLRVPSPIKQVVQTIMQKAIVAFQSKPVMAMSNVISGLGLPKMHWRSNAGIVIDALLRHAGYGWSANGRRVWLRSNPAESIEWQQTSGSTSLQPVAKRPTVLGQLDPDELQHDPADATTATTRTGNAAAAARPDARPRVLELVKPDKADKLGARGGSGWGNSPRPLARCCVCEQERLDALVAIGEEHARAHPDHPPLRRVDGGAEGVFRSSHSMGVVNVFRLTCSEGCCYNWSSAKPLPGPPAKPPPPPAPAAAAAEAAPAPAPAPEPFVARGDVSAHNQIHEAVATYTSGLHGGDGTAAKVCSTTRRMRTAAAAARARCRAAAAPLPRRQR